MANNDAEQVVGESRTVTSRRGFITTTAGVAGAVAVAGLYESGALAREAKAPTVAFPARTQVRVIRNEMKDGGSDARIAIKAVGKNGVTGTGLCSARSVPTKDGYTSVMTYHLNWFPAGSAVTAQAKYSLTGTLIVSGTKGGLIDGKREHTVNITHVLGNGQVALVREFKSLVDEEKVRAIQKLSQQEQYRQLLANCACKGPRPDMKVVIERM